MADEAALYHQTKELDFGFEDKRFLIGVLVVENGDQPPVMLGQIAAPGQKLIQTCRICNQPGHIAKECPDKDNVQTCRKCNSHEHPSSECPNNLCRNCNEFGHLASACSKPQICRNCSKPGHVARHCPHRSRAKRNRRVDSEDEHCRNCGELGHVLKDCMSSARPSAAAAETTAAAAAAAAEPTAAKLTAAEPSAAAASSPGVELSTWPPVPISSGDDTPAEKSEPEATLAEQGLDTPKGLPEAPPNGGIIVKMQSLLSPNHISSHGYTIDVHYLNDNPDASDSHEHKSAYVYFTGANFVQKGTTMSAAAIETDDPVFTTLVSPSQAETVKGYVGEASRLLHFKQVVSTAHLDVQRNGKGKGRAESSAIDGEMASEGMPQRRPLFGLGMYTDADFGPFTARLEALRNLLVSEDLITIHFFAVRSEDEVTRAHHVHESMIAQHQFSPLSLWWKQGKINPQKGQATDPEERPSGFKIHKRFTFMNWDEYVTIWFHNLTRELESIEAKGYQATTIRVAKFPGGGDQLYYAHLDAPPDSHYREGATVKVKLLGPDASDDDDWDFRVVEPFGWSRATQYAGFLFRPRKGRFFVAEPELVQGQHTINTVDYGSSEAMFAAMSALDAIKCDVHEQQPRIGVRRAINTLNHMFLGGAAFAREQKMLLANDLGDIPTIDYFGELRAILEDDTINSEVDQMREGLDIDQQQVLDSLRSLKGGMLLVQGPGGCGKSKILTLLCRLQYRLRCKYRHREYLNKLQEADELQDEDKLQEQDELQDADESQDEDKLQDADESQDEDKLQDADKSQEQDELQEPEHLVRLNTLIRALWVVSPINKQLDDLAEQIDAACNEERDILGDLGLPVIVIRRYMGDTEKHIYRRRAEDSRKRKLKETFPLYYDEDHADQVEAEMSKAHGDDDMPDALWSLLTAIRVQGPFSNPDAPNNFDKRLKLPELSEGRWILRRAGVVDEDTGKLHEIAAPETYRSFRSKLEQLRSGAELEGDFFDQLTLDANSISKDLADMAIVICMTPDVASQFRTHSPALSQPFAVLHDEASKAPEMGTLAALVFSRPYAKGNGPLHVAPDSRVPHILFGDIYQPSPVLGRDAQCHPFGQQNSVSLFQRWVMAGAKTIWLWEQHRSNQDITDLNNCMHPRGRMRVSSDVEARLESAEATACAQEIFGCNRRAIFINVRGTTHVLPTTKSRYNDKFIGPAIAALRKILLRGRANPDGFRGQQMAIIASYVAQVAGHRHVLTQYTEWLMAHGSDSEEYWLGEQFLEVEVYTVDKMQGSQKEVIVHDTTTSEGLGFTIDPTRQLLADGRARSLLIKIGDPTGVKGSFEGKNGNPWAHTAYYKSYHWCAINKSVLNLAMPNNKINDWQVPGFDLNATLKAFHLEMANPNNAFQFDQAGDYGHIGLDTDGERGFGGSEEGDASGDAGDAGDAGGAGGWGGW